MILRYFYDDRLAQASYLVGCAKTGEALVIDPARNIAPYLKAAAREGLQITHVTETHIHADFVSGSRELAAATGASIYLSDMGDAEWKYAYAADSNVILVRDGDSWMVGNVRIEVLHTPGHTPEHIAFQLTDTAASNRPMGVFTGDFVFVGDVGRPDLLEEAAGYVGTKEVGARAQFQSVARFKTLPDYLQIWPGHGAGSACGKALGAIPSTTLGYEKFANPAFQFDDEDAFVQWLLDGQPEPPRYFAQMKRVNKLGPVLLQTLTRPSLLERPQLDALLAAGSQAFDLRDRGAFARGHVPGTINIPMEETNYTTYVGWLVNFDCPLAVILPELDVLPEVLADLRAIGVDNVTACFGPTVVAQASQPLPLIAADALAGLLGSDNVLVVDVRGRTEYNAEHIRGALNIPLGYLPRRLNEVPSDKMVVTQCAGGYRSQIAASLLQAAGYTNAFSLTSGESIWSELLPTESAA